MENDKMFIKLTGHRVPLVHDLFSIFSNKTIKETFIIPISSYRDSIIKGSEMEVIDGYYKYQGAIIIKGDKLKVDLQFVNTDDNKLDPQSFNGEYKIIR